MDKLQTGLDMQQLSMEVLPATWPRGAAAAEPRSVPGRDNENLPLLTCRGATLAAVGKASISTDREVGRKTCPSYSSVTVVGAIRKQEGPETPPGAELQAAGRARGRKLCSSWVCLAVRVPVMLPRDPGPVRLTRLKAELA